MKLVSIIKKTNNNKTRMFDNINTSKHYPSSTRYWYNSIFMFNNSSLSLITNISRLAIQFIRNYFYLYNKKIESKIRKKKIYNRRRKLSTNRIFISKGEFKHTNNKVVITIYIYNKQKNNYLLKLKKRYLNRFVKNMITFRDNTHNLKNNTISSKSILLKKFNKVGFNGILSLTNINRSVPKIATILKDLQKKRKIIKFKPVYKYISRFYKRFLRRYLKRIILYTYYRNLVFVNRSKLNYTYLQHIKNELEIIFNKNVEFNIINLKHFYLNSDILSESILLKITRKRKNLMKYLSKLKKNVKIRKKRLVFSIAKKENLNIKRHFNYKSIYKNVIKILKYKHMAGFRLEANGRLNRRYTASRSVHKLKYKGNLLNVDSSYKGLHSVLLRNNLNSNLQFTKLSSKTRIGSFGLKGWVSGI
jgi:hypothetical protein